MPVKYEEFKGNKTIVLSRSEGDTFPFSFGLGKAKLILENIDEIQKFVNENDKPKQEQA